MKRKGKCVLFLGILLGFMILCYCLATFTNFPVLSQMKDIWIETAMTTADHQWLATKLFPEYVVNEVMAKKVDDTGVIGVTKFEEYKGLSENTGIHYNIVQTQNTLETLKENRIKEETEKRLKEEAKNKLFSDEDEFGNKVVVNDKEEGIKIVEIKNSHCTGKLVFIDDPSRVFIAETDRKNSRGKLILDYLEDNDAILGINANGFMDPNGKGLGGEIIGYSVSDGEVWGKGSFSLYTTIGFDENNSLVVGKLENPEDYNLRDAAQFKPAIIANGEVLIKGTAGWGLQPRTLVGQRADGIVMFLVVDGRKPGYSIGMTMGEAAEIMSQYGAVNAAACDGGSSSVLAYDGKIINKPSTPMKTGRYLPNAFLVKSKKSSVN